MQVGNKWLACIYAGSIPTKVFDSIPCYEPEWVPLVALEWARQQLLATKEA